MKAPKAAALLVALLIGGAALAAPPTGAPTQCNIVECRTGSIVATYGPKSDPYFACPTMALSEYTNTVVGALAVASALGTQAPAIEPNTGEPQLQNPVKALMHSLRTKAGVRSFDEAVAACKRGPNKALFRVADFQKSRHSMLVVSKNDARESFWIPTSNADLKR